MNDQRKNVKQLIKGYVAGLLLLSILVILPGIGVYFLLNSLNVWEWLTISITILTIGVFNLLYIFGIVLAHKEILQSKNDVYPLVLEEYTKMMERNANADQ